MHPANSLGKCALAAAVSLGIACSATANGSVIGVWHGSIRYDLSKLPSTYTAAQRSWLTNEANQRLHDKLTLTFRKDNKFSLTVQGPSKTPPPVSGKWSQSGDAIQIQIVKNGKPNPPETFQVSKDGKTITFSMPPVTYKFWR